MIAALAGRIGAPYIMLGVALAIGSAVVYHKLAVSSAYDRGETAGIAAERAAWEEERRKLVEANKRKAALVKQDADRAVEDLAAQLNELQQQRVDQLAERSVLLTDDPDEVDKTNVIEKPPTCNCTINDWRPGSRLLHAID